MRTTQTLTLLSILSLTALGLAGCGVNAATTSALTAAKAAPSRVDVATVEVNKMAQMLPAAATVAAKSHEATFILTALTASGKPAVHQAVTFYIGPMKPLSGIAPKAWYASGTSASTRYIAAYSAYTNASGKADIILKGQPSDTMEMIGVKVGNLSSYSVAAKHAIGSMDAWWTSASAAQAGPIGDYVTVQPFLSKAPAMSDQRLVIGVFSPRGPVRGAHVSLTMKSGGAMSAGGAKVLTTGANGRVQDHLMLPGSGAAMPIRIVVTQPHSAGRIAGGMNAEWLLGKAMN